MAEGYVKYNGSWFELGFERVTLEDLLLRGNSKSKTEIIQKGVALYAIMLKLKELGAKISVSCEGDIEIWQLAMKDAISEL